MRTMIAAAVAVAVRGVSQSGMAGMAEAEKWVDSEFQPSIHLAWLGFVGPPAWAALGISAVCGIAVFRWV